jgi:hypothetical protein
VPNLNLDIDYFTHPKTKRLIRLLGKGSEVLPLKLWCYTARYFPNGRLTEISAQEIETEVGWCGEVGMMVKHMIDEHWIDPDDDKTMCIHDWSEREGHLTMFKERATHASRTRWQSKMPFAIGNASGNASSITTSNAPTIPTIPTKPNQPPWVLGGRFQSVWAAWEKHRGEVGHKLTPSTANMQIKKLCAMGEERAVACIEYSISQGWQGLFEATKKNGHPVLSGPVVQESWRRDT